MILKISTRMSTHKNERDFTEQKDINTKNELEGTN